MFNPCFLSFIASNDVASSICQVLRWGAGASNTDKEIVFDASSDPGRGLIENKHSTHVVLRRTESNRRLYV